MIIRISDFSPRNNVKSIQYMVNNFKSCNIRRINLSSMNFSRYITWNICNIEATVTIVRWLVHDIKAVYCYTLVTWHRHGARKFVFCAIPTLKQFLFDMEAVTLKQTIGLSVHKRERNNENRQ